jgi:hypothetical protein
MTKDQRAKRAPSAVPLGVAVSAIAVGLGLGWACSGSEPQPQTAAIQPTATWSAPPPMVSMSAPPVQTAPPQPTTSPIAAVEPALAQAAQAVLNEVAKTEAPRGAKALGLPNVALLGTGQSSETQLTMQPGKCYTIISVGLPPVNEIDVQLLPATTVPGLQTAMAQDNMVGPRAIVGKAPNCYRWPLPVAAAARIVTVVPSGQGLVATQAYEQ